MTSSTTLVLESEEVYNQMASYSNHQSNTYNACPVQTSSTEVKPKSSTGKKRPRSSYSDVQVLELEKQFMKENYITRIHRIELAKELKLTQQQVKVWFQNRRMKLKKENNPRTGAKRNESLESNTSSSTSALPSPTAPDQLPPYPHSSAPQYLQYSNMEKCNSTIPDWQLPVTYCVINSNSGGTMVWNPPQYAQYSYNQNFNSTVPLSFPNTSFNNYEDNTPASDLSSSNSCIDEDALLEIVLDSLNVNNVSFPV